jgi:hypothetical protein
MPSSSFLILTRFGHLLLVAFGKLLHIYTVKKAYKREQEPVASPQLTAPHSTGNTSAKKGASATATHVEQ